MKINSIQVNQNQNFKARLVKTPALYVLLDKIATDYSRNDAARFCKKLRRMKPDNLIIKMPEIISNYNGRKIVLELELLNKHKKTASYVMPVSESRSEIMYPMKIFRNIKKVVKFYMDNILAK